MDQTVAREPATRQHGDTRSDAHLMRLTLWMTTRDKMLKFHDPLVTPDMIKYERMGFERIMWALLARYAKNNQCTTNTTFCFFNCGIKKTAFHNTSKTQTKILIDSRK